VVPDGYHSQKVSRYKTPENSVIFAFISMILMSAALSPRMPIGWKFLSLSLLAGSVLALIFYWSRWRGRGSNGLNYAVPVAGGAVAAAAMIGLGMVMTHFSFLRIFLDLVLKTGAVIAVALHWLHSRPRDTSLV
jgi:peptidoglycan biosynthesis protein MviN/MurJ (putative lipid II flippase)